MCAGGFSAEHKAAFADPRVSFVQADLTRDAHVDRAFNPAFGPYDYVFNLAGETKCGLAESVYASKVGLHGDCPKPLVQVAHRFHRFRRCALSCVAVSRPVDQVR